MAADDIILRVPSKYASSSTPSSSTFTNPPLAFLHRTWTVTHSTLAMWHTAQNVRITYTPLPPAPPTAAAGGARPRVDDLVQYEKAAAAPSAAKEDRGRRRGRGRSRDGVRLRSIAGVDTARGAADTGAWAWRGRGLLLGRVTSRWEVLGWGERADGERWAVTWFAATLFTREGVDVCCDRRAGMSAALARALLATLRGLAGAGPLVGLVEAHMREVAVVLPWEEG